MIPGAGGFNRGVYLLSVEALYKSFDFCICGFEFLFFQDGSLVAHGSCLDKVFMDVHSYIDCTHIGITSLLRIFGQR